MGKSFVGKVGGTIRARMPGTCAQPLASTCAEAMRTDITRMLKQMSGNLRRMAHTLLENVRPSKESFACFQPRAAGVHPDCAARGGKSCDCVGRKLRRSNQCAGQSHRCRRARGGCVSQ